MVSRRKVTGWITWDLYSWKEWYISIFLGDFRADFMKYERRG